MSRMQRWSHEKLQKELCFAHLCADDDAESREWCDKLEAELRRRVPVPAVVPADAQSAEAK